MFRPQTNFSNKSSTTASPSKSSTTANNNGDGSQSTIREIRSRTISSTTNNNARQLLANRRQAMSMERLNSSSTPNVASIQSSGSIGGINDKEKCSPTSGSSNSINGSTASSPSRSSSGGGLNRTASRVSRFRSAKAVFERLSSANSNQNIKPDRPAAVEKPKGTVASRYAAAAAARAAAAQQQSPRTRITTRTNNDTHAARFTANSHSPKHDTNQPKPQPRVTPTSRRSITTTSMSTSLTNSETVVKSKTVSTTGPGVSTPTKPAHLQSKPPPRDLIDKIVLEIAAENQPDANCTIQDLNDCNVSGIPETLDFDRCFQDVEMMTEEEARKLLSRKSDQFISTSSNSKISEKKTIEDKNQPQAKIEVVTKIEAVCVQPDGPTLSGHNVPNLEEIISYQVSPNSVEFITAIPMEKSFPANTSSNSLNPPSSPLSGKSKVRFSDELVQVYDTHAVEDYDRRNNDIDPATASIEYEIEKSKERAGIRDSDDDDDDEDHLDGVGGVSDRKEEEHLQNNARVVGAVAITERFNQSTTDSTSSDKQHRQLSNPSSSHDSPHSAHSGSSHDFLDSKNQQKQGHQDGQPPQYDKDYVESLQRELGFKRILEQNLRDLQSQYYEAVRELDDYKGTTETKIASLRKELSDVNNKCETSQSELSDVREQSSQFEKQLNDTKESSQLLEKKYHRAKRIIKDMQLREESFTRREQLYQQKLDEIEFELGVLINSIDKTIYDDGLKYFNLIDNSSCQLQHQTRLDVFGLIKQMLNNFNANQSTQNAQIKQRVVTILEQQLASLMATTNGGTCVSGPIQPVPPVASTTLTRNSLGDTSNLQAMIQSNNNNDVSNKHSQNYHQFASHRLSQPNLPHPIGVGGQPTKLFHGLNPVPIALNEPSPPQSVNSYPSSNSLNSLNNNNNNNTSGQINNNNVIIGSKLREQQPIETESTSSSNNMIPSTNALKDESFQSVTDIQVPYQTNEWHDKPVSEWTTNQVSTWLLALGLDQYISKFEDRNVNGQSLINLDSTVLKGLGVLNSNDRNLLKKKIRELRVEMEKERKLIEKKMKENLKDKSKIQFPSQTTNNKSSWKKGLLS